MPHFDKGYKTVEPTQLVVLCSLSWSLVILLSSHFKSDYQQGVTHIMIFYEEKPSSFVSAWEIKCERQTIRKLTSVKNKHGSVSNWGENLQVVLGKNGLIPVCSLDHSVDLTDLTSVCFWSGGFLSELVCAGVRYVMPNIESSFYLQVHTSPLSVCAPCNLFILCNAPMHLSFCLCLQLFIHIQDRNSPCRRRG